jgi:hypothetical protein
MCSNWTMICGQPSLANAANVRVCDCGESAARIIHEIERLLSTMNRIESQRGFVARNCPRAIGAKENNVRVVAVKKFETFTWQQISKAIETATINRLGMGEVAIDAAIARITRLAIFNRSSHTNKLMPIGK